MDGKIFNNVHQRVLACNRNVSRYEIMKIYGRYIIRVGIFTLKWWFNDIEKYLKNRLHHEMLTFSNVRKNKQTKNQKKKTKQKKPQHLWKVGLYWLRRKGRNKRKREKEIKWRKEKYCGQMESVFSWKADRDMFNYCPLKSKHHFSKVIFL